MTAEQRRQVIDFGKIRGAGMPIPTGNMKVAQRAHIVNVYFEVPVATQIFWRNRNLVSASWVKKSLPSQSWKSRATPKNAWRNRGTPTDGNTQTI